MKTRLTPCLLAALLGVVFTAELAAQTTTVTYQGQLTESGSPATGHFDFTFTLYDTSGGGVLVAGPITNSPVEVSNGLFTVTLDFGAGVFDGSDRWLEIGVATNGGVAFATLTPRQPITSSPYAIRSATANVAASLAIPFGMVLIPAGEFTLGDTLDGLSDADPTNVTVSAFYMDAKEVSWSQWQSVYFWATSNGYQFGHTGAGKAPNHPAQQVDWYDCVKWCNARSEQAGLAPVYYTDATQTIIYRTGEIDLTNACVDWMAVGYRLPTEAEWEKAARGGLSNLRFPWGDLISQNLANYYANTAAYNYDLGPNGPNPLGNYPTETIGTTPVGIFAPNPYGLYDMAGNVYEWVWDWYAPDYPGGNDPHGPAGKLTSRIWRGGNWGASPSDARCASRDPASPSQGNATSGFRCVLSYSQ